MTTEGEYDGFPGPPATVRGVRMEPISWRYCGAPVRASVEVAEDGDTRLYEYAWDLCGLPPGHDGRHRGEGAEPVKVELPEGSVIHLRPGDAVVLKPECEVSPEEADAATVAWVGAGLGEFPMVMVNGADVLVQRPSDALDPRAR